VNSSLGRCRLYLAVEALAGRVENDDCGGRTPLSDVIDVSYAALVLGAFSSVPDAVPDDDVPAASTERFPFLAPPHRPPTMVR
jgi:hypothetical protein